MVHLRTRRERRDEVLGRAEFAEMRDRIRSSRTIITRAQMRDAIARQLSKLLVGNGGRARLGASALTTEYSDYGELY